LLFSLGIAVGFGSVIGVALIPAWWLAFLSIVLMEEASMERELGQAYRNYKQQVRGRIIPGLPV
jgi:protein-S-isoprenylcysteine O-methyltransferase Ste14